MRRLSCWTGAPVLVIGLALLASLIELSLIAQFSPWLAAGAAGGYELRKY